MHKWGKGLVFLTSTRNLFQLRFNYPFNSKLLNNTDCYSLTAPVIPDTYCSTKNEYSTATGREPNSAPAIKEPQ